MTVALLILEWVWSVSLLTLNLFVEEPHSSLWESWMVPSSIKPSLTSPPIIQLLPGPSPLSTVITELFIQRSTIMCYDYFLPYLSPLMEWPFLCSCSYFLCPVQCSVLGAFKLLLGRIKGKWIVQRSSLFYFCGTQLGYYKYPFNNSTSHLPTNNFMLQGNNEKWDRYAKAGVNMLLEENTWKT